MRPVDPSPLTFVRSEQLSHQLNLIFSGKHNEHVCISIVDGCIVRVCCYPDGKPRNAHSWMVCGDRELPKEGRLRDGPDPLFSSPSVPGSNATISSDGQGTRMTVTISAAFVLIIDLACFQVKFCNGSGDVIASDLAGGAYEYDQSSKAIKHFMAKRDDYFLYGLGEVAGPLEKSQQRIRMAPMDTPGYNAQHSNPLYKHFPFVLVYAKGEETFCGLLYDNLSATTFDLGKEIDYTRGGSYLYYSAEDGDLDYYFIMGEKRAPPQAILTHLCRLTGFPLLPPIYALGYGGSAMKYTESADAQAQLREFAVLCDRHDMPCDLFHLSSGYTVDDATASRYVFTWNLSRVPDPRRMTATFHENGIRVAANVKPHLLVSHPLYSSVRALGGFVCERRGDDGQRGQPSRSKFWKGGLGTSEDGSVVDFTSYAGFEWWVEKIKGALLAYGIDAIWNDNNEMQLRDDEAVCSNFGRAPMNVGQMRPVLTLLMAYASYQAMAEFESTRASPFLISRAACLGMQKFCQTWSGDNFTSWHTLKYNIPMGLSLSISGMPSTGHDVGGFVAANRPSPELFLRWVQSGVFSPRFCIHSWHPNHLCNEPWMHESVTHLVRAAIHFRYMLILYIYQLFRLANSLGQPIIRPMFWDFYADEKTLNNSFDFMLGPYLLVASIFEAGTASRGVYLPKPFGWYDFYSGVFYPVSGTHAYIPAPLEHIPLLAREGAIIPVIIPKSKFRNAAQLLEHAHDHFVFVFPFQSPSPSSSFAWTHKDAMITVVVEKNNITASVSGTRQYPLGIFFPAGFALETMAINGEPISSSSSFLPPWSTLAHELVTIIMNPNRNKL